MAEKKFEKALERLENIVKKMETGEMTLDESLKAFQEGIELSRFCMKKLDEAERTVEKLLKEGDGIITVPFTDENGLE
ncbi:MAG: exodeoxyribonuclease VII small subunit [Syntrophales bacterium]|nr:exodeoxyribonuclease VII small subunit [Syntrophales bacterium]